jgi:hypothetical protein
MKVFLRHFFIALLPVVFGVGAGWAFAFSVPSCGRLVGPVFGPMCHWRQLEYQIMFMMAGMGAGWLIATILGTWLELRSRRAVQRSDSNQGGPS